MKVTDEHLLEDMDKRLKVKEREQRIPSAIRCPGDQFDIQDNVEGRRWNPVERHQFEVRWEKSLPVIVVECLGVKSKLKIR